MDCCSKHKLHSCSYCHTTTKNMIQVCRRETCYTPLPERVLNNILCFIFKDEIQ